MGVTFDFGTLVQKKEPDYSVVADTMEEVGEVVARAVRASLSGSVLPGMTQPVKRPHMAEFVRTQTNGAFSFTVTMPEEVSALEAPRGPYDMKPALLNGPRHRVDKQGHPYNIIPFKHNATELPGAVAEMASNLKLSAIVGHYLEVRPDDQWEIMRNTYKWGTNTGTQENKRHSNMYNFGNGKLITFRTVSTKSPADSWIHPGRPGNPITESAWNFVEPTIADALVAAWGKALMEKWR